MAKKIKVTAPRPLTVGDTVTWKNDPSKGLVQTITDDGLKSAVKWTYAISGKVRTSTVLTRYLTVIVEAPPVKAPRAPRAPKVTAPEVTAPEVTAPEVTAPEVTAPEVTVEV